jgi:hypothetical protein
VLVEWCPEGPASMAGLVASIAAGPCRKICLNRRPYGLTAFFDRNSMSGIGLTIVSETNGLAE